MAIELQIGNRIKELREKRKMTQLQLAQKAGLNRTFIVHVEKGRRNISVKSLEKILKALKIPFSVFFKRFF